MRYGAEVTSGLANTALVVVTYNRADLLRDFLVSVGRLDPAPDEIIVVNNASTDGTDELLEHAQDLVGTIPVFVHREPVNTGGAGGFHRGTQLAVDRGFDWIWLMDDDVEVAPDGLAQLAQWTDRFWCLQGTRVDAAGGHFRWQPYVTPWTVVPATRKGPEFDAEGAVDINSSTFEGLLLHRDVVAEIGLPDPRFFLVWDDVIFGWLASRRNPVGYVNNAVLQRKPKNVRVPLAGRNVNQSSKLHRYYVVRNRGYVARYFALHGEYRPLPFAIGTAVVVGKELARIVITKQSITAVQDIWRGLLDGQRILRDRTWRPMPGYTRGCSTRTRG